MRAPRSHRCTGPGRTTGHPGPSRGSLPGSPDMMRRSSLFSGPRRRELIAGTSVVTRNRTLSAPMHMSIGRVPACARGAVRRAVILSPRRHRPVVADRTYDDAASLARGARHVVLRLEARAAIVSAIVPAAYASAVWAITRPVAIAPLRVCAWPDLVARRSTRHAFGAAAVAVGGVNAHGSAPTRHRCVS